MSHLIDITGQRFGKLTVIARTESNEHRKSMWRCLCDCGNETFALGASLRRGEKKSCGCLSRKYTETDGYCEYCGEPVNNMNLRYCSRSCAAKAAHGVKRVNVDMSYGWKKTGAARGAVWVCRYNEQVSCEDRNCAECGWNPEVAKARLTAIMEQNKEGDEHGQQE